MDLKLINNSQLALTDGYLPVEYIESSGVVNIDTGVGIVMNKNYHSIKATIEVIENNGTDSLIFSAFYSFKDTARGAFNLFCNGTSVDSFKVQAIYPYNTNLPEVSFSGKTTIEQGKGYITINGVKTTVSTSSTSYTFNLFLLKGDVKVRIWNFQVLYNGTPVRNYIPVVSYQEGHFGEACLYDTVNNVYKYSSSTGSFTASTNIYNRITTAFVKDCPNISGIDLLRRAINLQRVRCNVGDVSGTLEELQHYATLSGYSDDYEEQTKPRIIGTFTVSSYHTTAELSALDGLIDGLTIISNSNYNINALISNDELAVQTFDENADNYNPAVAIKLNNNNIGYVHTNPITLNGGRYLLRKTEAANCSFGSNTFFNNVTTLTDDNGIVSDDDTQTYDFESFDEFKYFTKYTSIPGGVTNQNSLFGRCSKLQSIVLPSTVTSIGNYGFANCDVLNTITIPATCTSFSTNCFVNTNSITDVYYEGSFEDWMNITFGSADSNPCKNTGQLYIQNVPLTSVSIPENTVTIKAYTFHGMNYITGQLIIPDSVTSIGTYAFYRCGGLTGDIITPNSAAVGNGAFVKCSGARSIDIHGTVAALNVVNDAGNGTGTLTYRQNISGSPQFCNAGFFKHIVCYGNVNGTTGYPIFNNYNDGVTKTVKVKGDVTMSAGSDGGLVYIKTTEFVEIMGAFTRKVFYNVNKAYNGFIIHLGSNTIAGTAAKADVSNARCSKVYVGDGTSRANDEAVLALYLADTNWSAQSAKLGTWYDYNGEYKWYYITDNLTNCTNTNPDAWPHITRGESYETTIVPDEGMTINSLTVEMLDTDTTSPTYDTYIPQPTSYDSATGIYTISIPSVTGNVVITASAS